MRARVFRIVCCAGLLAAIRCSAQDSGVVIRSTTNLVQVRLVAEDSKGRPVTDLRQKDFQIFDDGKPQPITLFTSERDAVTPGAPGASAKQAANPAETDAGYALIVLDWLNTAMADRVMAIDQAIRQLKNFQPRQKVGIYLLGHESRLVLDFTSDRAELAQAVEDAGLEFGRLEDAPRGGKADGGRGAILTVEEQIFSWQNRVLETLRVFGEIGDMLGRLPGRKTMIWLSEAFPTAIDGNVVLGARPNELLFLEDVETALGKLNRADVAVYAVDAAGLSTVKRSYGGTMDEFASRTGGTTFAGRNDLDEGMRLALEDMRASYTLGFHVPEAAAAGLHEIRVRVNRPGLKLRYRESYEWAGIGRTK